MRQIKRGEVFLSTAQPCRCVHRHRSRSPAQPLLPSSIDPTTCLSQVCSGTQESNIVIVDTSTHTHPELNNKQKQGAGLYLLPLRHLRGRRRLRFLVHSCGACVPATVAFFAALTLCASLAHPSPSRNLRTVCRELLQSRLSGRNSRLARYFDMDSRNSSGDDVGGWGCFAGSKLGCAGWSREVVLEQKNNKSWKLEGGKIRIRIRATSQGERGPAVKRLASMMGDGLTALRKRWVNQNTSNWLAGDRAGMCCLSPQALLLTDAPGRAQFAFPHCSCKYCMVCHLMVCSYFDIYMPRFVQSSLYFSMHRDVFTSSRERLSLPRMFVAGGGRPYRSDGANGLKKAFMYGHISVLIRSTLSNLLLGNINTSGGC